MKKPYITQEERMLHKHEALAGQMAFLDLKWQLMLRAYGRVLTNRVEWILMTFIYKT